ncbi:hypothetical protein ACSIGC_11015 [Tenacibaculum sp. ZS6-P6]|uniref:hypothetical protein n=1 Tax=Tenacibaculum sp. ZS6-P6 TaxID=3447503 RepID=UPI003F9E6C9C
MRRIVNTILSIVALFILFNCSDKEIENNINLVCSVEKPIEDLSWLKSKIEIINNSTELSKYNYIVQIKHNNEMKFVLANCNPAINSVFEVKNCSGITTNIVGSRVEDVPFETFEQGTIIWKSNQIECQFQ